jgi:hypothetical protein
MNTGCTQATSTARLTPLDTAAYHKHDYSLHASKLSCAALQLLPEQPPCHQRSSRDCTQVKPRGQLPREPPPVRRFATRPHNLVYKLLL